VKLQNSRHTPGTLRECAKRWAGLLFAALVLIPAAVPATTIVPISDRELLSRADVVVRGVVTGGRASEDALGRPETITTIAPLEVLKGDVSGSLVLHQLGGRLPDGRFFQIWGRPEYQPGHEVVVFAVARPEGGFQTAEMLLGKFEVQRDEDGQLFAVPSLAADAPEGVTVRYRAKDAPEADADAEQMSAPRSLPAFLRALRHSGLEPVASAVPSGVLKSEVHAEYVSRDLLPNWGNLSGLWRWTNGATAVWKIDGTANITGGGTAEVTGATASWDNESNSTINYSVGSSGTNPVHVDALTSPCGWTTCLAGGGVIGCGGPTGGAATTWRGENYMTITGGEVWVRSFCTTNLYPSVVYQAVVTHELGHTLGLGHSDQVVSPHDVCRGDEDAAQMRSVVQSRTTLGTDDSDAVRWLYGDGGNSCGIGGASPPTATTLAASSVTATSATLNGSVNPNGKATTAIFQYGTTAAYGSSTASQSIGSGTSDVAVSAAISGLACGTVYHFRVSGTNSDGTSAGSDMTLTSSACTPAAFDTITPCRLVDTRNPVGPMGGPSLLSDSDRSFTLTGQCGIPSGAQAVAVNVTVVNPTNGPGVLTLYPSGIPLPTAATVNYKAGQIRGNAAMVSLGATGGIAVHCSQGGGTADMVIDVTGYFK
jgi:hypothetical protein